MIQDSTRRTLPGRAVGTVPSSPAGSKRCISRGPVGKLVLASQWADGISLGFAVCGGAVDLRRVKMQRGDVELLVAGCKTPALPRQVSCELLQACRRGTDKGTATQGSQRGRTLLGEREGAREGAREGSSEGNALAHGSEYYSLSIIAFCTCHSSHCTVLYVVGVSYPPRGQLRVPKVCR
jgi:hypothetical protein